MTWIRVDQSLRHHRKLLAFGNELGIETAPAIGHLVLLWSWCLDNAPTGILKRINGQQISTACAWTGNPNDLVNALLSAGFLEKCGRGGISLRIHGWYEYAGKLLEARAANRERMRRARAGATVRNSTKRNDTKENDLPLPCPPFRGTDDPPSFQRVSLSDQDPTACTVWDGILGELKSKVTKPNWETWLKNTVGFAIEEDRLVVVAPNEGAAEWLSTKLRPVCAKEASHQRDRPTEIEFAVAED